MPKPVFLLMPEWQGSSSSRAMQIAEGAAILRGDLPRSTLREVAVPLEAGDAMGTPIARLSSVLRAREAARDALREVKDSPPLIVGGDCATSLSGVEAASARYGDDLAVLWFDAHPDLQHPSTSPSGAASGMTLRHALGDGFPELAVSDALTADQLTLVGTRACDPEEDEELQRRAITVVSPEVSDLAATVTQRLRDSGAHHVYIHVDVDVIDPSEFTSVHSPVPFGLSISQLTAAIRAAVDVLPLAGGAVCEFAPADELRAAEDLPTMLRLFAALTSGCRT